MKDYERYKKLSKKFRELLKKKPITEKDKKKIEELQAKRKELINKVLGK